MSLAALSVSEKVRREIESSVNCNGKAVTASFGIAALLQDDSDKTLIDRARQGSLHLERKREKPFPPPL